MFFFLFCTNYIVIYLSLFTTIYTYSLSYIIYTLYPTKIVPESRQHLRVG